MKCEICEKEVRDAGEHYIKTRSRRDRFWSCHDDVGKCRCAKCDHVWRPRWTRAEKCGGMRTLQIPDRCPSCGERGDLFWADDGGWERAAREKQKSRR